MTPDNDDHKSDETLATLVSEMPRWQDRLVQDASVYETRLIIKDTKIRVDDVIASLFSDLLEDEILERHPGLTTSDLRCCLKYAGTIDYPDPTAQSRPLTRIAEIQRFAVGGDPEFAQLMRDLEVKRVCWLRKFDVVSQTYSWSTAWFIRFAEDHVEYGNCPGAIPVAVVLLQSRQLSSQHVDCISFADDCPPTTNTKGVPV